MIFVNKCEFSCTAILAGQRIKECGDFKDVVAVKIETSDSLLLIELKGLV